MRRKSCKKSAADWQLLASSLLFGRRDGRWEKVERSHLEVNHGSDARSLAHRQQRRRITYVIARMRPCHDPAMVICPFSASIDGHGGRCGSARRTPRRQFDCNSRPSINLAFQRQATAMDFYHFFCIR
jgi:hypothetical protein